MSRFLKVLKDAKIDFANTVIEFRGGSGGIDYFKIKPKDFIRYSKIDLKEDSQKGLLNSITNAKRAIDCQIDTILNYFGITFDKIPESSNSIIETTEVSKKDLPHKLKLIEALKFAPGGLTSKARILRNKLEHYYEVPHKTEIEEAIEVAELFILSCESRAKMFDDNFMISSTNYSYQGKNPYIKELPMTMYSNNLQVLFDYQQKRFEVEPIIGDTKKRKLYFDQKHEEYYYFLRLINTIDDDNDFLESLIHFLDHLEHPIPSQNIKIANWT